MHFATTENPFFISGYCGLIYIHPYQKPTNAFVDCITAIHLSPHRSVRTSTIRIRIAVAPRFSRQGERCGEHRTDASRETADARRREIHSASSPIRNGRHNLIDRANEPTQRPGSALTESGK